MIAGSACLDVIELRPELRSPAVKQDAIGLADKLETLIDAELDSTHDREAAYQAVKRWHDKDASYAYARANLAGRLAEARGMSALYLVGELEKWARVSLALDPRFRNGAARRMLGTVYVLAPASLIKHGDSEEGLELLEKQVSRYPQDPQNHLRLAEGYISLGDPEGAFELLCHCQAESDKLRPSERRLLTALVRSAGGFEAIGCDESE